jgi:eukaryotic-like serine/threonine-protein kinase
MAKGDSDRNLLLGILALQMDFIGREALIAGMNAWVIEKEKSLGQILVGRGALAGEQQALLEALVRAHVRQHGDDPEKSLAALGPAASVREALRQVDDAGIHATLDDLATDGRGDGDEDPYATSSLAAGGPGAAGLRFRILRAHARGGLGEVFVAYDEELRREVALKEIRDRFADDPDRRARFLREAEVTGGLEHPGIVPVYGLGAYPDGRPYYAMRFIRGESLRATIERFHGEEGGGPGGRAGERGLGLQKLLRRFLDVCNAVAYAHSRGVLHRDLKPANVVVGRYGETLVVDWGLAKPIDRIGDEPSAEEPALRLSSAGGSTETMPGSAVGTPSFMSPEQAAGRLDRLGPASDVYSLGATLYALLTGHAPFEDRDVGDVLDGVRRGDFPPPRARRPGVPRPLEAICLKAMALRPEDRYSSARALAEDVERWLADEKVSAFREPMAARVGRWARRHRPLVAGAAALLAATAAALAIGLVLLDRERARTEKARREATERAEALQASLYYTRIGLAESELAHGNLGRVGELLDECPPGLRRWEWHYLKRMPRGDRPALYESPAFVISIAFSPDGRRLASADYDGTVRVTDVATGEEAGRFRAARLFGKAFDVAFSPDGRQVAAATSALATGEVKVWDLASGREAASFRGHSGLVLGVAFSPDGRHLASAGMDKTVRLWDLTTRQEVRTLRGHADTAYRVAYHPDGRRLASAGWDGRVRVWDVETGEERMTLDADAGDLWCLAYDREGRRLAAGGVDGSITVWDAATGGRLLRIPAHFGMACGVAFSADGRRIASSSWDRTVRLWDAATGREVLTLRGHTDIVNGLGFSPDGRHLASSGWDKTVRIWDATPSRGEGRPERFALAGLGGLVFDVTFSPDGRRLASAGQDKVVTTRDAETGRELRTFRGHRGMVYGAAFSLDGRRLASIGADGQVTAWDAETGREVFTVRDRAGSAKGLAFSPDGRRLASPIGREGTIKVWDAETGREIRAFLAHLGGTFEVAYSPDGRRMASAGLDQTVKVWDAEKGDLLQTFTGHGNLVMAVAFHPDGRHLASAGWDGTIRVWDIEARREVRTLRGHADRINDLAYSPDGRYLASASWDGTARVWEAESGRELLALRGHSGVVLSVAFTPDGTGLASSGGYRDKGEIKVWDLSGLDREVVPPGEGR